MKRNSITTTLSLRLESDVCLPNGSEIVISGDLRGPGWAETSVEPVRSRNRSTEQKVCRAGFPLLRKTEEVQQKEIESNFETGQDAQRLSFQVSRNKKRI